MLNVCKMHKHLIYTKHSLEILYLIRKIVFKTNSILIMLYYSTTRPSWTAIFFALFDTHTHSHILVSMLLCGSHRFWLATNIAVGLVWSSSLPILHQQAEEAHREHTLCPTYISRIPRYIRIFMQTHKVSGMTRHYFNIHENAMWKFSPKNALLFLY